MGGGASAFENEDDDSVGPLSIREVENGPRYFCHGCHRQMTLLGVESPADLTCPVCESTFLELLPPSERTVPPPRQQRERDRELEAGEDDMTLSPRALGAASGLSESQSRRLTHAAFMLRMLEARLRDELEFLQRAAIESEEASNESMQKSPKMSLTQISKLKTPKLSVDLCCAQPSCPLCMEDYRLDETSITQLPCSHIFHEACVMQWLDLKNSCPICRESISNELPTVLELEARFTEDELASKISAAKKAQKEVLSGVEQEAAAGAGTGGGTISGVSRSSLASRIAAGAPSSSASSSSASFSASGVGSDEPSSSSCAGPLTPSKRALAEELITLVQSVEREREDKEREEERDRRRQISPVRFPIPGAFPPVGASPWRPRVLGGPIPVGMLPRGEIIDGEASSDAGSSGGGRIQLQRMFAVPSPTGRSLQSRRLFEGPGDSNTSNARILQQLRNLNRSLEEASAGIPDDLPSILGDDVDDHLAV